MTVAAGGFRDKRMFVDAIAQGLALVAPSVDDPDDVADRLVDLIGVWHPAVAALVEVAHALDCRVDGCERCLRLRAEVEGK